MKSIALILFCLCPTLLFSQSDTLTNSISSKELAEIIITAKRKEKISFHTFDLTKKKLLKNHSLQIPLSFHENTSTGIFVPASAIKNLIIDRISFPIYFFNEEHKELPLLYYIGLKYANGEDTLIQITSKEITIDDNEVILSINQDIRLLQSIQGFYFFIKYNVYDSSGHSNINVFYNDKYKSKLCYKLNSSNNIETYDLSKWVKDHTLTPNDTKHLKSLNWRVKITYAAM